MTRGRARAGVRAGAGMGAGMGAGAGVRRACATAIFAAVIAGPSLACHRHAPTEDGAPTIGTAGSSAPAAPATPVDHLAPGELLEGPQQAFGLKLPRDLRVEGVFVDVVYATGPATVHPLVQYFRARLTGGGVREGATSATFDHVRVPGQPSVELLVRVAEAPGGARVEVRDVTPRPAPKLPDEAARWRQVGLTPDGRLADPTHLE